MEENLRIKQSNYMKIIELRSIISKTLESGFIKEEDIIQEIKLNAFDALKKQYKYKEKILSLIYECPFLLCDQESLSLNFKKLLPLFLKTRYDMELNQLEYEYSGEELRKQKELLKYNYYESSNEGMEILKNGHVNNVINNKIRTYKY